MNLRLVGSLFVVFTAVACDDQEPVALQSMDMRVIPMDVHVAVDMMEDAEPDAAPVLDMRIDAAPDVHVPDVQVDAQPDAAMIPVGCERTLPGDASQGFETPEHEQVTVAYGGRQLYLVWSDSTGVHQCTINEGGAFEGERLQVEGLAATSVTSLRVGGTTWIAYGGPDVPIRVYQAHRPQGSLFQISSAGRTLVGKPQLADAGGSIMVIGQTPEGAMGWQIIPPDLGNPQPFFSDPYGLPIPDSVGAAKGGVLLRFGEAGQCVFVNEATWRPEGNVPCRTESGELVSSGDSALLWHLEQLGDEQFLTLRSLYDPDGIVRLGKFEVPSLVAPQLFRGHKPLVGRRTVPTPEGRRGDLQLYLAGSHAIWESMVTWSGMFPWTDMRAVGFLDMADRVETGTCSGTENECADDTGCEEEQLCQNAAGPRHALVIRFHQDPSPVIETVPMIERSLHSTATIFDVDPLCAPVPEYCDNRDQDCDGQLDDGLCCGTEGPSRVLRQTFVTPGPVQEFLMGDNEWRDAYVLAYRYLTPDNESVWEAIRVKYIWDNPLSVARTPIALNIEAIGDCNQIGARCLPFPSDGSTPFRRAAGQGRFFNGVGGTRVFIARTPQREGEVPRWGVHWIHRQRDLKGTDALPTLLPENCDQILAVEALRSEDGESVVVVCRDRILKYYADTAREDQEWFFEGADLGRIQPIEWATVRRRLIDERHDSAFDILVGFRSSLGNRRLRLYDVLAGSNGAPQPIEHPDLLNLATDGDLEYPIHLNIHPSGPPIRTNGEGRPQALFSERNAEGEPVITWRDIVTSATADGVSYAVLSHLLFTSAEVVDPESGQAGRAFWAVDTLGNRGEFNLWSTSPIHTEPRGVSFWSSTPSDYARPLLQVVPINEEGTEFEVGAIELSCRSF